MLWVKCCSWEWWVEQGLLYHVKIEQVIKRCDAWAFLYVMFQLSDTEHVNSDERQYFCCAIGTIF